MTLGELGGRYKRGQREDAAKRMAVVFMGGEVEGFRSGASFVLVVVLDGLVVD